MSNSSGNVFKHFRPVLVKTAITSRASLQPSLLRKTYCGVLLRLTVFGYKSG